MKTPIATTLKFVALVGCAVATAYSDDSTAVFFLAWAIYFKLDEQA